MNKTELLLAQARLTVGPDMVAVARRISAAQPRSERWQSLARASDKMPDGAEVWENTRYEVTVRRHSEGWPFGGGDWVQIGISAKDGSARHDWREFQRIKNDIVGPAWEAIELYPAESRLLDPSNYYILWCAPAIPVGKFEGRMVATPENCAAPQRGWRPGEEPAEL
jgi:hypothetical protein